MYFWSCWPGSRYVRTSLTNRFTPTQRANHRDESTDHHTRSTGRTTASTGFDRSPDGADRSTDVIYTHCCPPDGVYQLLAVHKTGHLNTNPSTDRIFCCTVFCRIYLVICLPAVYRQPTRLCRVSQPVATLFTTCSMDCYRNTLYLGPTVHNSLQYTRAHKHTGIHSHAMATRHVHK